MTIWFIVAGGSEIIGPPSLSQMIPMPVVKIIDDRECGNEVRRMVGGI
jgi:hypothetical protein